MAYKDARVSSFHTWMIEVSREIETRTSLEWWEIEDWNYRDAYDDGVDPDTAAIRALENAGWEG